VLAHSDRGIVLKILVAAVGHKMPNWINMGFHEYAKRIPREHAITLIEVKPETRSRTHLSASAKMSVVSKESDRLLAAIPKSHLKIVLSEKGVSYSTLSFAKQLEQWMKLGRDIAFLIGGADGIASHVKRSADKLMTISEMTLPHGLVRVVLVEQLYRAFTLLNGHPYHRE
jgi:23S rRNA (pseudouridine1915-N3)-methyltransferase